MSGSKEYSKKIRIMNSLGLHARPAAEFVKLAGQFDSDIWVSKDGVEVNGKSIMGVMMLAAEKGSTIEVKARGEDAREAVQRLDDLVSGGFGEE